MPKKLPLAGTQGERTMADILDLVDLDELRTRFARNIARWPLIRVAFSMSIISIPAVRTRFGWATHRIL